MKKIFFILLAFSLLAGSADAKKQLFKNKPGMVSYTYRNSFARSVPLTLDTIKALGITDMEFSNLFGHKPNEIKDMLEKRGMTCSSFGTNYADLTTKTREVGAVAKALGANYVRVAWIPHTAPYSLETAKKNVADFNQAGKILKEEFNLTFCYHNHGFEFYPYQNGTLFDYLVQNTIPKYVSFELDILWAFFPGHDPALLLQKYPKRFKLLHLKDLRKGVKGNLTGQTPVENDVALGTGQLDIPTILKAAKKAGVKHYYIEDESPSYGKQVVQTIEFFNNL